MSFGEEIESPKGQGPSLGPQERINYRGDLRPFLEKVTKNYGFGQYLDHEVKKNGYEDLNLILRTTNGPFFIKNFASWRTKEECSRYLEMMQTAYKNGVITPSVYTNTLNDTLTTIEMDGSAVHLCAMEYLDGGNIFEGKKPLTTSEQASILREAVKIANTKYQPKTVYDSWAIVNLNETYRKNRERVILSERKLIEDLLKGLERVDIASLPHSFVHGDIRSTNVMRHSDGKVYVIDFSVANWYPRLVEFAVIASDILFDPENPQEFPGKYNWALNEYQKLGLLLTAEEKAVLPLFVRLAHAANVIGASSQTATNYISQKENNHWLALGKKGLHFTVENWKPES